MHIVAVCSDFDQSRRLHVTYLWPGNKLVARQWVCAILDGPPGRGVHPGPDQRNDGWITVSPQERENVAVDADPPIVEGEQYGTWWQWTPAFTGVERRLQELGTADGITVIDDYAHHPTEIAASIAACRTAYAGRPLLAAFQPHLFTRTRDFAVEFGQALSRADQVWVTDVYPAREAPIEGVSRDALVEGLRNRGHRRVLALQSPEQLAELARQEASAGDLVVCLGAGNITSWANALPGELQALYDKGAA